MCWLSLLGGVAGFLDGGDQGREMLSRVGFGLAEKDHGFVGHRDLGALDTVDGLQCGPHCFGAADASGHAADLKFDARPRGIGLVATAHGDRQWQGQDGEGEEGDSVHDVGVGGGSWIGSALRALRASVRFVLGRTVGWKTNSIFCGIWAIALGLVKLRRNPWLRFHCRNCG